MEKDFVKLSKYSFEFLKNKVPKISKEFLFFKNERAILQTLQRMSCSSSGCQIVDIFNKNIDEKSITRFINNYTNLNINLDVNYSLTEYDSQNDSSINVFYLNNHDKIRIDCDNLHGCYEFS